MHENRTRNSSPDHDGAANMVMTPDKIRTIREKLRDTQAEFAERLGVAQSTVACWESGTRRPSGTACKLIQIVGNFNVKVVR